jgi:hypothetical protein
MRSLIVIGLLVLCSCASNKVQGERANYTVPMDKCRAGDKQLCQTIISDCYKHDIAEACVAFGEHMLHSEIPDIGIAYLSIACDEGSKESCERVDEMLNDIAEKSTEHLIDPKLKAKMYKANRGSARKHIGMYKHAIRRQDEPIRESAGSGSVDFAPMQNFFKGWTSPTQSQNTQTNCTSQPIRLADGTFKGYQTVCK